MQSWHKLTDRHWTRGTDVNLIQFSKSDSNTTSAHLKKTRIFLVEKISKPLLKKPSSGPQRYILFTYVGHNYESRIIFWRMNQK